MPAIRGERRQEEKFREKVFEEKSLKKIQFQTAVFMTVSSRWWQKLSAGRHHCPICEEPPWKTPSFMARRSRQANRCLCGISLEIAMNVRSTDPTSFSSTGQMRGITCHSGSAFTGVWETVWQRCSSRFSGRRS